MNKGEVRNASCLASAKPVVLTGDRPTGPLHLGHYIGSLASRVQLQETYAQFVMIADIQALTDNFADPVKVISHVQEVAIDYLAVGIDPMKTTIFIQSQVPALAELTMYFLNLVHVGRLERNPTVKLEIQQKNYGKDIPAGFLCYPISQAADITAFKAGIVPVGNDQLPMIEQTNEIVRRFNRLYHTDCLKEVKPYLSHAPRLVGIDGQVKASKSLNNAIFLSDSPEAIKKKVFSMFTDPGHLKVSDPGRVERNVVFDYLDIFHPHPEEVSSLKEHYRRGGLGDTTIKALLNQTLQDLLAPIRQQRSEIDRNMVLSILEEGSRKASLCASKTLKEVQEAIGIRYF